MRSYARYFQSQFHFLQRKDDEVADKDGGPSETLLEDEPVAAGSVIELTPATNAVTCEGT